MLIGVLAFLINADTIHYGFTFDDPLVLVNNKFVLEGIRSVPKIYRTVNLEGYNGEKESNYRPFSISQFAVEHSLFGKNPAGFHFFQVLYYSLACGLVTELLLVLFKALPIWVPVSIALVFTLHPLHAEVVANIKSRDEIMGMIGILLTLILLLKESQTKLSALLLFLTASIAFFSKESALPLVVAAPVTIYFFKSKSLPAIIKASWPIWISAAVYLFMRQVIAQTPGPEFKLEENALFAFSIPERWFAAMALVVHYVKLFLLPITLRADYSYDQLHLRGWEDPLAYLGLFITMAVVYCILKGFKSRSVYAFGLLFSALFYIVTANLIVLTGATLAERFMFVPSLGMIMVLIYFLYDQLSSKVSKIGMYSFVGVWALGLGIRTLIRNKDWKDNHTIYTVTGRDCTSSVRAQTKLARFRYDEAILPQNAAVKSKLLTEGMTIADRSLTIYEPFALTHYVRGLIYKEQNRYQQAIVSLHRASQLNPSSSTYPLQAGLCYGYLGQDSLAMIEFMRAETNGSKSPITFHELARRYYLQGQFKTSLGYYLQVLSLYPEDIKALSEVTKIYRDKLNDIPNARVYNDRLMKASNTKK